jgi:hypothetical protein
MYPVLQALLSLSWSPTVKCPGSMNMPLTSPHPPQGPRVREVPGNGVLLQAKCEYIVLSPESWLPFVDTCSCLISCIHAHIKSLLVKLSYFIILFQRWNVICKARLRSYSWNPLLHFAGHREARISRDECEAHTSRDECMNECKSYAGRGKNFKSLLVIRRKSLTQRCSWRHHQRHGS